MSLWKRVFGADIVVSLGRFSWIFRHVQTPIYLPYMLIFSECHRAPRRFSFHDRWTGIDAFRLGFANVYYLVRPFILSADLPHP